ncbi:MAG: PD-(D/E)XK nuclease family protein, partial [Bacteroidetes bacterium]|nr:PD-(D/E)XK nuclease family protein [Bacteroidota bacterium]
ILLPIDDAKIKVKIKGFIDRIDRAGSTIRIIDYKTGNVKKDEITIKTYEQLISESKLAKSLQLLTYAYLFNKNTNTLNLSTGIFTFRSLSKGFCSVTCPDTKSDIIDIANLQEVENALLKIISSIFDKNIPFTQTADTKICKNCPFTEICNK